MFYTKTKKGRMVDIHCHILPGVDDGSKSISETVGMLRCAQNEGIEAMIATPHYKHGRHNASLETIQRRIAEIREIGSAEGIDIKIYSGSEVFFFHDIEEAFDSGKIATINNTDHLLVEFSPSVDFTYIRNAVFDICNLGLVPIIAHVERYECMLRNYSHAEVLKQIGAKLQINTSSVAGKTGRAMKKYTIKLCKNQLIDYMGTDAHDERNRKPEYRKVYAILAKVLREDYLDDIFYGNAMKLLDMNSGSEKE